MLNIYWIHNNTNLAFKFDDILISYSLKTIILIYCDSHTQICLFCRVQNHTNIDYSDIQYKPIIKYDSSSKIIQQF